MPCKHMDLETSKCKYTGRVVSSFKTSCDFEDMCKACVQMSCEELVEKFKIITIVELRAEIDTLKIKVDERFSGIFNWFVSIFALFAVVMTMLCVFLYV